MTNELWTYDRSVPPDAWTQDAGGIRFVQSCLNERHLQPGDDEGAGEIVVFAIHRSVWSAAADVHRPYLTDSERERSDRYRRADDQKRFVVGRAVLRFIAAAVEDIPPSDVPVQTSEYGRPIIQDSPLSVNVSHSGEWVVVAAGDALPLGVDVEQRSANVEVEGISSAVFSTWERDTLLQYPHPEQAEYFFDIWARKEAFIKADGRGIQFGLDRFDVEFRPDHPPHIRSIRGEEESAESFQLRPIRLDDQHAAALCYRGAERSVSVLVSM